MKTLLSLVAVACLSACATSYQPDTLLNFTGGYKDSQLDKNIFSVAFQGNGYTSTQSVSDMLLLRSAELTLKHGFSHFVILNKNSEQNYMTFTMPGSASTYGNFTSFGSTTYFNAQTSIAPRTTLTAMIPSATNMIACFNGKPNTDALVFDARFVYNSLILKYKR